MANILWYMFILIGILIILRTYYSLYKQFKYASYFYDRKQNTQNTIYASKKETPIENIISSNMTQRISTHEIDIAMNYPILYFRINNQTISIPLSEKKVFIGRSPEDDIVINEKSVSRSQCYITSEKDKYFINIKGGNPISLNKKQITKEKEELTNGDVVYMGRDGMISFKFAT